MERAAAAAQAEPRSVEYRAEAMRQGWNTDPTPPTETARAAAQAERDATVARARHKVSGLRWNLAKAASDKKAPIEKQLSAALEEVSKAEKAAAAAGEQFTPLPGAKWSATQFGKVYREDAAPEFPSASTGRRLALARWLTDARNLLPARVAANHIRMRHMGRPLVHTVFDFGRKGAEPSHPELLDWLASELAEGPSGGTPWG